VLLQGGTIVEVGTALAVPAGARRIDARGKIVTPGFIDAQTTLGLADILLSKPGVNEDEPSGSDPIHAAYLASDGLNPRSVPIGVARVEGVTTAVAAPGGGLIAGRSAWIDLDGDLPESFIGRSPLAMHATLGIGGALASGGGARAAALERLRETLDDARQYARRRQGGARDRGRPAPVSNTHLTLPTRILP
jgi:hypothetical protein